ncbi:MAG: hypothetical protein E7650_03425 [Ruminococcaceae bacterium]|nr:hypothetical protein [Oscillospiraceae bacterium]
MNTIKINCEKKPLMVAHRGCSGLESENTNAAFVAAGNRSYYGIETDIHKTVDGKYIVIHDDNTRRVTGDNVTVEATTFDTLRRLTVFDKASGKKSRSDLCLPSLEEYIGICKKYEKCAVLELKNAFAEADIYEICDIIEGLGYLEHTTFISFCYDNLVYLHRKHPEASAQFLISTFDEDLLGRLLAGKFDLDINYKALSAENIALCHENGITVNAWTVDDKEAAEQLAAWGVDMITSNILE